MIDWLRFFIVFFIIEIDFWSFIWNLLFTLIEELLQQWFKELGRLTNLTKSCESTILFYSFLTTTFNMNSIQILVFFFRSKFNLLQFLIIPPFNLFQFFYLWILYYIIITHILLKIIFLFNCCTWLKHFINNWFKVTISFNFFIWMF